MRAEGWAEICAWQMDRAAAMPFFRQIRRQVCSGIPGWTLKPGTKRLSTRDLAVQFGVAHRMTRGTSRLR